MALLNVTVSDFCQFEQFYLDLHNQGLVWIGGENNDSESASNNGAGKSNLFKAIGWGIYGDCIDGKRGDEVIREGATKAVVCLSVVVSDVRWVITRLRRRGGPKLELTVDGEPFDAAKGEIQDKINELVGMDWQAFRNTVLFGQEDRRRFIRSETTDKERKLMLHQILETGVLKECHARVTEQKKKLRRSEAKIEARISVCNGKISAHNLDFIHAEAFTWNDSRNREVGRLLRESKEFQALSENQKKLGIGIPYLMNNRSKLFKQRREHKDQQQAINICERRYNDSNILLRGANKDLNHWDRKVKELKSWLEKLSGDDCPVCESDLKKGRAAEYIAEQKALLSTARKEKSRFEKDVSKMEDILEETRIYKKGLTEELIDTDELETRIEKLDEQLEEAKDGKNAADVSIALAKQAFETAQLKKDEVNPHDAALARAESNVKKLKDKLKTYQLLLKRRALQRAHVEFWVKGFSDHGLPSFVMDSVMPYLTERTNHYLDKLADGDIQVNFSTQRELKSSKGEFRDEISVGWLIEGVSDYPPSGGQWKKMELSSDLALMDLAASRGDVMDLLCLDEALDGLDSSGRQRILDLLHDLRSQRGSIFVISHDSDMSEIFEKAVKVVKTGGVSVVECNW